MNLTPREYHEELQRLQRDIPQIKEYLDFRVKAAVQIPCPANLSELENSIRDYRAELGEKGYHIYANTLEAIKEMLCYRGQIIT